jgi:hypothetical protein
MPERLEPAIDLVPSFTGVLFQSAVSNHKHIFRSFNVLTVVISMLSSSWWRFWFYQMLSSPPREANVSTKAQVAACV